MPGGFFGVDLTDQQRQLREPIEARRKRSLHDRFDLAAIAERKAVLVHRELAGEHSGNELLHDLGAAGSTVELTHDQAIEITGYDQVMAQI